MAHLLLKLICLLHLCGITMQVLAVTNHFFSNTFDPSVNWQAFFKAVEENNVGEVRRIITRDNPPIHAKNTSWNREYLFSSTKKAEIITLFLDYNILNIGTVDQNNNTFLHQVDTADIAQVLLDYGINVNVRNSHGMTPLHTVKKVEVVQVLMSHDGVEVNAMDKLGRTPLSVHVMGLLVHFINDSITTETLDRLEIIRFLMENKAKIHFKAADQEMDITSFAKRIGQMRDDKLSLKHLETVRLLVKNEVPDSLSEDALKILDTRIAEAKGKDSDGDNICSNSFV